MMGKSEMVLSKMFSGRFVCIVLFSSTACYLAVVEGSIRDAFFALVGGIIRDYFGRGDRQATENTTSSKVEVTKTETPKDVANGLN